MFDDSSLAALESSLLAMLHTILGEDGARPEDSFFDVGAGSLLVVQMYALIEESAPGRVTLQDVLDHSSVAALAARMFHVNGSLVPRGGVRAVNAVEI